MRRYAAIASVVLGIAFLSQAAWIHGKALLAQVLIAHAWERNAKPWPWADTHPVARLTLLDPAPRRFTVLAGASGRNLAFGPVHDSASVLPGDIGNSVIAGHRDTHFRVLRDVNPGERVRVERADGNAMEFVVVDRRIVDSRVTRIALDADAPRLTLVTCYPFEAVDPGGPLRLVITAEPAGETAFTWHTASRL
ncbi:MAG: class GN sortase [Steroidobacteraceae bacterium]